MIAVTAIPTGTATLKAAQEAGRDGRGPLGRKLDILRDRTWVGPLPIFAFLIEHPEGRFLVDTGDTWRTGVPGYLPRWHPFYAWEIVVKVAPHEEIGPRLQAIGLDPSRDIGTVILTHLHHDHTGGLHHFPHSRIVAARETYAQARGARGMIMGCLPQHWPVWFKPDLVDLDGPAVGAFPASRPMTRDGRIVLVPTPGHVRGHLSVLVRGEGVSYLLAGDATYREANLRAGKADGVTGDPAVYRRTLETIKAFAASEPTVILPTHDPDVPERLAQRRVYS